MSIRFGVSCLNNVFFYLHMAGRSEKTPGRLCDSLCNYQITCFNLDYKTHNIGQDNKQDQQKRSFARSFAISFYMANDALYFSLSQCQTWLTAHYNKTIKHKEMQEEKGRFWKFRQRSRNRKIEFPR